MEFWNRDWHLICFSVTRIVSSPSSNTMWQWWIYEIFTLWNGLREKLYVFCRKPKNKNMNMLSFNWVVLTLTTNLFLPDRNDQGKLWGLGPLRIIGHDLIVYFIPLAGVEKVGRQERLGLAGKGCKWRVKKVTSRMLLYCEALVIRRWLWCAQHTAGWPSFLHPYPCRWQASLAARQLSAGRYLPRLSSLLCWHTFWAHGTWTPNLSLSYSQSCFMAHASLRRHLNLLSWHSSSERV